MKPTSRAIALALLTTAIITAPAASADPGDEYNDGLASTICQLLDTGWSEQRIAAELASSMPAEIVADEADAVTMVRWAIDRDCPEHA